MNVEVSHIKELNAVSIYELPHKYININELPNELRKNEGSGIKILPLSFGGGYNTRFIEPPAMATGEAHRMALALGRFDHFQAPPQSLYLIDQPCVISPQTGAIFLPDGRLIAESIYPSSGNLDIARILGRPWTAAALKSAINSAPDWPNPNCPSLIFSRWSNVYFHAFTESLVHFETIKRIGVESLITYASPAVQHGSQKLISERIGLNFENITSEFVRAPRILSSSLIYSHSSFGSDFNYAVESMRRDFFTESMPLPANPWRKIYVSRLGASARKMINEPELISQLGRLGFAVISAEKMGFLEQANAFRDAQIIVGAHGAGLVNSVFARPNSQIIELRPLNRQGESPMWGTSYVKIAGFMGFSYTPVVSKNEPDSETWICDVDIVVNLVKKRLRI